MSILLVHPDDDMVVALTDQTAGATHLVGDEPVELTGPVEAKHKFARRPAKRGERLKMYGIVVAEAVHDIRRGDPLTTQNIKHATTEVSDIQNRGDWQTPDVSRWTDTTFQGFHRPDGRVGTRNHWIVVPLVFCQNLSLIHI